MYTYPHTIDNGAGERLVFLRKIRGQHGDRLEGENVVSPGAGPPMHVHHLQEEALTVVSGMIGFQRPGEAAQFAGPGEQVVFKAGEPHKFWNAGKDVLHCTAYIAPPDNIEFFLGAILSAATLARDVPESDHCGSCRSCLDACPTAAFPAPYRLDARRCISYLTIEHKGPIPHEFRAQIGNRIYGCDDCLAVCPWNKFAAAGREAKLAAREALRAPKLAELARLDDAAFRALFAKSPVKRTGRDRFVRNVAIAMGNSADAAVAADAERLLDDASPLVRGAAVWALWKLAPARLKAIESEHRARETNDLVLEEWSAA